MKKSKIECIVRGNQHGHWLHVSGMSKEEYNTFFRIGLQAYADKLYPGKIKVVKPSENIKPINRKVELDKKEFDRFAGDGVKIALKEQLALLKKSNIIKKTQFITPEHASLLGYIRQCKKVKGVSKKTQDFYTEYKRLRW